MTVGILANLAETFPCNHVLCFLGATNVCVGLLMKKPCGFLPTHKR